MLTVAAFVGLGDAGAAHARPCRRRRHGDVAATVGVVDRLVPAESAYESAYCKNRRGLASRSDPLFYLWRANQTILRGEFCAVKGLPEACFSKFTARFRHSGLGPESSDARDAFRSATVVTNVIGSSGEGIRPSRT